MQSDFNEAVGWWVATGINLKMLSEYEAQFGSNNFWIRPKIHGDRPLMISHILPAFILLGFTMTVSLIVFISEIWFGRKKQGVGRRNRRVRRETWVEGVITDDMRRGKRTEEK